MGVGNNFGEAFVESQLAAGAPAGIRHGVHQREESGQARAVEVARGLHALGFKLVATRGTRSRPPAFRCSW